MNAYALLQIGLFLAVLVLLVKPLGWYMARVYEGKPCGLGWAVGWLERLIYRVCGIDPNEEMAWTTYAKAMLVFNLLGIAAVYVLQRVQGLLPLNPQHMAAVPPDLAMNTAVSFATNTNWQSYSGETHAELPDADARPDRAELPVGGHGHGRDGGLDSRIRPAIVADDRQLLVRPDAEHALYPSAAVDRRGLGAGVARRGADVPTVSNGCVDPADDRRRRKGRCGTDILRSVRRPRRSPSSNSAPTAAAFSTPIPRIPSRIRRRRRTSSNCCR